MKQPIVNFRDFRINEITKPKYNHILYIIIGWVWHLTTFSLVEKFIPTQNCFPIHSRLDDIIPFCEWFILPYVLWYFLIIGTLSYFLFYNPQNCKKLMKFIVLASIMSTIIFLIFPNRQDLRPTEFLNNNFCVDLVKYIYSIDTNTNVCPSMHVAISVGIAYAWIKENSANLIAKILLVGFCILVCLSVVFVKQHSVIDICVAIPVSAIAILIGFKSCKNS